MNISQKERIAIETASIPSLCITKTRRQHYLPDTYWSAGSTQSLYRSSPLPEYSCIIVPLSLLFSPSASSSECVSFSPHALFVWHIASFSRNIATSHFPWYPKMALINLCYVSRVTHHTTDHFSTMTLVMWPALKQKMPCIPGACFC